MSFRDTCGCILCRRDSRTADRLFFAAAALRSERGSTKRLPSPTPPTNGWTPCRMPLQIFSAGSGKHSLRHCENPSGPYVYRGLPAFASLSMAGSDRHTTSGVGHLLLEAGSVALRLAVALLTTFREFCESTFAERSAGNLHPAFCGSRRRVTASGDPVGVAYGLPPTRYPGCPHRHCAAWLRSSAGSWGAYPVTALAILVLRGKVSFVAPCQGQRQNEARKQAR